MPSLYLCLLFTAALVLSGPAYGKDRHDLRPLNDKEKETFYPMVCNGPADTEGGYEHSCDRLANNLPSTPANVDAPTFMTFVAISYGSYSKADADEAFVLFHSNLGGEGNRGMGAILFERKQRQWKIVNLIVRSALSECVAVPGNGQQKLLCLDAPMKCCGQSPRSINLITGMDEITGNKKPDEVLASYDGRRGPGEGDEEFCEAGKSGKTLLLYIDHLKRSSEPNVLAEAEIKYATPVEINKTCAENPSGNVEHIESRVRFALDGEKVKVLLPEGVNSFSVY